MRECESFPCAAGWPWQPAVGWAGAAGAMLSGALTRLPHGVERVTVSVGRSEEFWPWMSHVLLPYIHGNRSSPELGPPRLRQVRLQEGERLLVDCHVPFTIFLLFLYL